MKGKLVSVLLDLVLPLGGSIKYTELSTMLNEPLWTLTVSFAEWGVAPIPNTPLSTLTTGKVEIPRETSVASLIVPVGRLEKPTCSIFIYSSLTFNTSLGWIDPIPLKTNWVAVELIAESKVCEIDVNVIGCCTTPSKPMMVLVSCFFIVNLCTFPEPRPVKVIAAPVATYSGLENNWNLFWSIDFAKTVDGKIVVTTPAVLAVDPIDKAVAAIPTKVESNEYISSSFVLKKWFGIVNIPVVVLIIPDTLGLNVLV